MQFLLLSVTITNLMYFEGIWKKHAQFVTWY
jgi:hypothetical protein